MSFPHSSDSDTEAYDDALPPKTDQHHRLTTYNRNCDELPESDLRAPSELPESSQSESSLRAPRERPERSLDASKEPFIKTKAFNRLWTDVKKNLLLTIKWLECAGF